MACRRPSEVPDSPCQRLRGGVAREDRVERERHNDDHRRNESFHAVTPRTVADTLIDGELYRFALERDRIRLEVGGRHLEGADLRRGHVGPGAHVEVALRAADTSTTKPSSLPLDRLPAMWVQTLLTA